MSELERWQDRFAGEDYRFGTEPNLFLKSQAHRLRKGQTALSIADGEGRNGVFLAEQGLDVLSLDFSPNGQAKARKLAAARGVPIRTEQADVITWNYPPEAFDVVVAIFFQFATPAERAKIFAGIKRTLKPGGLLLLANNPQGGEHLKDLLVGQILWVSYGELVPALLLSIALLAFMGWRRGELHGLLFYGLFALAITTSVQLVGVYLVFASLIIPALATAGMQGRGRLAAAYIVGALGYASGLVSSAVFDLPSGALIVWMLAACGLLAQLVPVVRRSHPAHRAG